MKLFKREKSRQDVLRDKFENAFIKTGFIDKRILETPDRDLWEKFKEIISDENVSTIFSSMLLCYRELPYSEELAQKVIFGETSAEKKKGSSEKVYATINPIACRFYECAFVKSPLLWKKSKKGVQVFNTLERLRTEYKDWTKVNSVVRYLEEQLKTQLFDKNEDPNNDLFIKSTVTILVPELEDGLYYNVNGVLAFPYFSETYHYYKSSMDQIKFVFKVWYNKFKIYKKHPGFFDKCLYMSRDRKTGEEQNLWILYCKFFKKFYNPFMFFEPHQIEDLMEWASKQDLKPEVLELLNNNYIAYYRDLDANREEYDNNVPELARVYKENDAYYDKFLQEDDVSVLDEAEQMEEDDDIDSIENEVTVDDTKEDNKPYTISRKALSLKTLKSLIMGYNGKMYYSLYPHLGDILLKITDLNKKPRRGKSSDAGVRGNEAPQSLQLLVTIKSNSDLFVFNTNTNWLDFMYLTAYKKMIQDEGTKMANGSTKKTYIKTEDRFLTYEEAGVMEQNTVKSPETAGIVAYINPMTCYSDYFVVTKNGEVDRGE